MSILTYEKRLLIESVTVFFCLLQDLVHFIDNLKLFLCSF